MGGIGTKIMLDSGSSVSLLSQDTAVQVTGAIAQPLPKIQLQTASGESLPIIDYVSVDVQIGKMKTPVRHNFIIVSSLIAPVILGIDFSSNTVWFWTLLKQLSKFIPNMTTSLMRYNLFGTLQYSKRHI